MLRFPPMPVWLLDVEREKKLTPVRAGRITSSHRGQENRLSVSVTPIRVTGSAAHSSKCRGDVSRNEQEHFTHRGGIAIGLYGSRSGQSHSVGNISGLHIYPVQLGHQRTHVQCQRRQRPVCLQFQQLAG